MNQHYNINNNYKMCPQMAKLFCNEKKKNQLTKETVSACAWQHFLKYSDSAFEEKLYISLFQTIRLELKYVHVNM